MKSFNNLDNTRMYIKHQASIKVLHENEAADEFLCSPFLKQKIYIICILCTIHISLPYLVLSICSAN